MEIPEKWYNKIIMKTKITAIPAFIFSLIFFTFFFSIKPAYADSGVTIRGNVSIYDFENGGFIGSSFGDFSNFGTSDYRPLRNTYIEIEFSEWTISDVKTVTDENGNFSVNVRNPNWGSWYVDVEVNAWVQLDYNSGEPITVDCFEDSEDLFKYNFQTGEKSVGKNGTLTYDVKIGGPDNNIEDYWDADITSLWDSGAGTGLNHITAAFMSQVIKDGFDWLTYRNANPQDLDRTTCIIFPSDETGIDLPFTDKNLGASNIDKYKPMQPPPGTGHIHIIPKRLFPSQYTTGDSLKPVGYYWKSLRSTLLHEYGHKIMHDVYWDLPKPLAFWESFDSEHTIYTVRSPELGWVEGWAEFFAAAVQNWPTVNGTKGSSAINIEQTGTMDMSDYTWMTVKPQDQGQIKWHRELSAPYYDGKRDMNEGEVASVLWDIFDTKDWEYMPNEVQNMKPDAWQNQSFLQWYDRLEDSNLDRIWSIMRDHSPDCLMDEADAQDAFKIEDSFWYYWLNDYGNDNQFVHGLKAILYNRGIPSTKKPENAPVIISSSIDVQKHKVNVVIEESDIEDQPYLYYNVEYRRSPYEESRMMYSKDKLLSSLGTNWTNNRLTVSINIPSSTQWSNLLIRVHDSMLPAFQEYTNDIKTTTTTDTEDKGDLIIVGFSNMPHYITDMEVVDNYVHLVDGSKGYYVIDVSTPGKPVKVASFENWENCPSIDVEDNYAYIPNLSGEFHIVNISNPLNPLETSSLNLVDSVKKLPGYNIPGAAFDVKVEGNYAYIAGYNCFYVVDISEKDNPVLSGFMAIGGDYLDVSGNYAFVTDNNWGLHVFDVSDPAKPSEVCYYSYRADHKGNSAHQITINPELEQANIFCDAGGLSIIDISDPLDPVLISSIDNPQSVNHGAIKNNQIYIIEGDTLYIIDGSAPDKPAKIKSFILPSGSDKLYPNFLATDNAYFYAGTSAGLVIFGYKNQ